MYNVKVTGATDSLFKFRTIEEAEEFIADDLNMYKDIFSAYECENIYAEGKTKIWSISDNGWVSWERSWITVPKYEMNLYYGFKESDYYVSHSFRLEDATGNIRGRNIGHELAEELDIEPGDYRFNWDSISVLVPYETIQRIKADAIKEYKEAMKNGRE